MKLKIAQKHLKPTRIFRTQSHNSIKSSKNRKKHSNRRAITNRKRHQAAPAPTPAPTPGRPTSGARNCREPHRPQGPPGGHLDRPLELRPQFQPQPPAPRRHIDQPHLGRPKLPSAPPTSRPARGHLDQPQPQPRSSPCPAASPRGHLNQLPSRPRWRPPEGPRVYVKKCTKIRKFLLTILYTRCILI